ncbi:permease prefix domain 1-containing protein [Mucisphaera sp.]|uniref:permease prefix domain 1-containing protein n=1 Tax=Mucisphaera sp. TaxID=2913024 RepID=UPI003D0F5186
MHPFHQLAQRVTHRLKVDRELRQEVAREIQDHLEDAETEFLQAGCSQVEARTKAIRALGDEQEIAEGLWDANRQRLRWRAILGWAARITIIPTALLLMALLIGKMILGSTFVINPYVTDVYDTNPLEVGWLKQQYFRWIHADMSEDDMLIVYGGRDADTRAGRYRVIWERFPDQPMFYASYAVQALQEARTQNAPSPDSLVGGLRIEDILLAGADLDPQNGAYEYALASLYLDGQVAFVDDDTLAITRQHEGEEKRKHPLRMETTNRLAINRAAELIKKASAKPRATFYGFELESMRQDLLPEPMTAMSLSLRTSRMVSVSLNELPDQRLAARFASDQAIQHARAGSRSEAMAWVGVIERLKVVMARDADALIGLLVAESLHTLALETRVHVLRILGEEQSASAVREQLALDEKLLRDIRMEGHGGETERAVRYGMMLGMLLPAVPGFEIDAQPWRKLEYAVFDQGALMFILVGCNAMVLGLSLLGLLRWWRTSSTDEAPLQLWIGWKRVSVVLGLGLVLPTALAMIWWMSPWSSRYYGLNVSAEILVMEYVFYLFVMLVMLSSLTVYALYQRAGELGMEHPAPIRLRHLLAADIATGLLLLVLVWSYFHWDPVSVLDDGLGFQAAVVMGVLAVLASLLWLLGGLWWMLGSGAGTVMQGLLTRLLGPILVLVVSSLVWFHQDLWAPVILFGGLGLVLGMIWVAIWLTSPKVQLGSFTGSVLRSVAPLAAAGAVIMTAVLGPALVWNEARLTQEIHAEGMLFEQEIERSNYRYVREWLVTGEVPEDWR